MVVIAAAVLVSETVLMIIVRRLVVIFRIIVVVLELLCIVGEDLVTIGGVVAAVVPVFAAFMTDVALLRIALINNGLNVMAGRKVVMVLVQLLHLFH